MRIAMPLVFALAAVVAVPPVPVELKGKVTRVDGRTVTIRIAGDVRPRAGDPVRIGFPIDGGEVIEIEGTWRVSRVEGATVVADLEGAASGTPAPDHVATITTDPAAAPREKEGGSAKGAKDGFEPLPSPFPELDAKVALAVELLNAADPAARNEAEAHRLFREAADLGHVRAIVWLGWIHEKGLCGVAPDRNRAVSFYGAAADRGDAEAAFFLANVKIASARTPEEKADAVKWYRLAADRGDARAVRQLGWLHQSGQLGPADLALALSYYEKAASLGNADAQNDLGHLYLNGIGVPRDDARALSHFRIAADKGQVNALVNLAWMHESGRGVPRDDREAARLYRLAADRGFAEAQRNLGLMYEEGRGVERDAARAIELFRAAARGGSERARQDLERLGAAGK